MTTYDYNAISAGFAPDETYGNHLVVRGEPTSSGMLGDVPKVKKGALGRKPAIKLPCGFVMPQHPARKRARSATAAASSAESAPLFSHEESAPLFSHEEVEEAGGEMGNTAGNTEDSGDKGMEELDFQLENVIKELLGFNCAAHSTVHDMTESFM